LKQDIEAFRQKILQNNSKQDYAIITILAYAGLRTSEALDLKANDIDLISKEITVSTMSELLGTTTHV